MTSIRGRSEPRCLVESLSKYRVQPREAHLDPQMIVLRAIFWDCQKERSQIVQDPANRPMKIFFRESCSKNVRVTLLCETLRCQHKRSISFGSCGLRLAPSHERPKYGKHVVPSVRLLPFKNTSMAWNPDGFHAMVNMNLGDWIMCHFFSGTFPPWSSQISSWSVAK
jgi:hypothetical protein